MIITLKDGSKKEYAQPMSIIDIAADISEGLARVATAGEVNGEVQDLRTVLSEDCALNILTFDSPEGAGAFRHTTSHIIAGAAGAEYALESGAWKNGVFTSTIIQALQDPNVDANKDGKLTVEELQNYVTSKVSEQTNGEQKPSSVSSEGCEGFPLSLLLKHQDEEEGKTVENPLPIHESVATQCEASNNELDSIIQDLKGTSYKTPLEKLYQKRVLQLLERIKNGAPVDTVLENANGTTALHNACGLSRVDVVQWLVDHGANVNARTAKGASVETCVGGPNAATIYKILRSANK